MIEFIKELVMVYECPLRKLMGMPCPGCGMTRAVVSLLKCDFYGAWIFHPLVFTLPFALVAIVFQKKIKCYETLVRMYAYSYGIVWIIRIVTDTLI